jgi:hypothetical protein
LDAFLHQAWTTARPPFARSTLRPAGTVALEELSGVLREVVRILQQRFGDCALLRNDDWHEHDGYMTSSAPTDWKWLADLVASAESLYEKRPTDDFVRITVYDASGGFCLRVWIPEEDDHRTGRWGSFDISGADDLVEAVDHAIHLNERVISSSVEYFREIDAS